MSDMGDDIAKSLLKGCAVIFVVSAVIACGLIMLIKYVYHEFF
jgi:hypothetical protein